MVGHVVTKLGSKSCVGEPGPERTGVVSFGESHDGSGRCRWLHCPSLVLLLAFDPFPGHETLKPTIDAVRVLGGAEGECHGC